MSKSNLNVENSKNNLNIKTSKNNFNVIILKDNFNCENCNQLLADIFINEELDIRSFNKFNRVVLNKGLLTLEIICQNCNRNNIFEISKEKIITNN